MRGLFAPNFWFEVDFTKIMKDCSSTVYKWLHNEAVGTRAFIPNTNNQDECYAALQICLCALKESKIIPTRYDYRSIWQTVRPA